MTKPKIGGTKHRWLVEDTQGLLIELSDQHKAVIDYIQRGQSGSAALELAQASRTLMAIQSLIGQMQLLIVAGEDRAHEQARTRDHRRAD